MNKRWVKALLVGLAFAFVVTLSFIALIVHSFWQSDNPSRDLRGTASTVQKAVPRECKLITKTFVSPWNDLFEQTPDPEPNYTFAWSCPEATMATDSPLVLALFAERLDRNGFRIGDSPNNLPGFTASRRAELVEVTLEEGQIAAVVYIRTEVN